MALQITDQQFDELVAQGIDAIPDELLQQMENVVITVEQESDEGGDDLLGEYFGIPLTERYDYSAVMPDVIKIYKGPLCRVCESEEEIIDEVRITVIHEIAHHFGIDDEQLHELGWA
jgi:predicted Zn-dependent protease with MMP-like domain